VGTSQVPDAAPAGCRSRHVLERVGDKWSMQVIHRLGTGSARFNELRRGIDGVSQRMLTVTLRGLERDGIVSRTAHPVIPLRVDYALTPMGRTLLQAVCSLVTWAGEHLTDIDTARAVYDERMAQASLATGDS
jgi:DNA-binding HxlR family transcriptional regulator